MAIYKKYSLLHAITRYDVKHHMQAVWKSLPGWIVLTRRHAAEILALVNLLGGWRERQRQRESAKDEYFGSYKGTPAECWREKGDIDTDSSTTTATTSPAEVPTAGTVPVTDIAVPAKEGDRQKEEENEVRMQDSGQMVVLAHESIVGACQVADLTPVGESPHTQAQQQLHPQPAAPELSPVPAVPTTEQKLEQKQCPTALLSAWGRGGTWHERNSSVFAPEEVFFPTMLSLLGYLRADHVSSTANSSANSGVMTTPSGEVKIAAVTFAEWAKRGDANPIQYAHCDANLVKRMRRSGALFGRKFAPGSASWSQWQDVMNQLSDGEGLANNGRKTSGAYSDGGRNDYGDVYGDGRRIEQHDRDIIRFNSTNNYSSYDNHHSTSSTYYGGSGYSSHNYSRQYNSQSTYNREGGSRGEGYDGGREGSYPGGDYNRHGKEEHPGDRRNAPYDPRWQGNREHDSAKRRRY